MAAHITAKSRNFQAQIADVVLQIAALLRVEVLRSHFTGNRVNLHALRADLRRLLQPVMQIQTERVRNHADFHQKDTSLPSSAES